jgi:multidrug resistance efflux pump
MPTTPQTPTPTTARTPTPTTARTIGAGNGAAAALERITKLRDQGAISYEEFAAAKARIHGAGMAPGESSAERRRFEAVGANEAADHANVAADHANMAADHANVAADHDLADMSRTPS